MNAMSITTHVAVINQRAVFIKRAAPGEASIRLAHEAEMLTQAAGKGVMELVEFTDGADGAVLTTYFVGGGTALDLRSRREVSTRVVVTIAASLAETLADVHDRGLVHGSVCAEHVLAPEESPTLCGWAGAVIASRNGLEDPTSDSPNPHDDAVGLASLVVDLLDESTDTLAGGLRAVVARVGTRDADAAPSMRAIAVALRALVPVESSMGDNEEVVSQIPRGRALYARGGRCTARVGEHTNRLERRGKLSERMPAGSRHLSFAGIGAVVIGSVLGAIAFWGGSDLPASSLGPSQDNKNACAISASTEPVVDIDSDGCFEPVVVIGRVVSAGKVSWELGNEGDLVVVGDWDGDEMATPGIVRPSTGEVWIFERWAKPDEEVFAQKVEAAPVLSAKSAKVIKNKAGLDVIEITNLDGVRQQIL